MGRLGLKKPPKISVIRAKPKSCLKNPDKQKLEVAAMAAAFRPSVYHCPGTDRRVKRRKKPASECPRVWETQQGTVAIREAIRAGRVSNQWTSDGRFPRHVWHREGEVWYEACTSNADDGTYHGYAIDERALPPGLLR